MLAGFLSSCRLATAKPSGLGWLRSKSKSKKHNVTASDKIIDDAQPFVASMNPQLLLNSSLLHGADPDVTA